MLYSLSCAFSASVFQSLINYVLCDIIGTFIIAYIDDNLYLHLIFTHPVWIFMLHTSRRYCHDCSGTKNRKMWIPCTSSHFPRLCDLQEGVTKGKEKVTAKLQKGNCKTSWPQPISMKDLQWFLGFINFYQCFICSFSTISAPLTILLKGAPKKLPWTSAASEALTQLKRAFKSAPILKQPAPSWQFTGSGGSSIPKLWRETQTPSSHLLLKEAHYP